MNTITATMSGAGAGGLSVGAVAWFVFRSVLERAIDRALRRYDDLEADLKSIREKEMTKIESRIEKVENNCRGHQDNTSIARMETITSEMQKTFARFDETAKCLSEGLAKTSTKLDSFEGWIRDVRDEGRQAARDFRSHAQDAGIHHNARRT